jgi:predicted kinase
MWKFPFYEVDKNIDWNLLENKFTWLNELKNTPQDAEWHAEGNVFIHTQMVLDALIGMEEYQTLSELEKHTVFTAALFHDIEKRSTTLREVQNGIERIISPGHAKKGEYSVRKMLYTETLSTPFHIREEIAKLVKYHGLPLWAIEKNDPRKSVIEASLYLNTKLLYILAKADALGRICTDSKKILFNLELFKELCIENHCYGAPRAFKSTYGRFLFLNKPETSPDYEPFEDLKFEVIMLSGLPGTGKDTYIDKHLDLPVLSLDNLRREHKVSPTDKKKNGQIIQLGKEKAKEFMRAKNSFVFNGTNITKEMRNNWISLFTDYGGRVKIIYLEVPYKKLLEQNRNREFKVPENVIENLIGKLEVPNYDEAHDVEFIVNH